MIRGVCTVCGRTKTQFVKGKSSPVEGGDLVSSLNVLTSNTKLPWGKFPGEMHLPGHQFTCSFHPKQDVVSSHLFYYKHQCSTISIFLVSSPSVHSLQSLLYPLTHTHTVNSTSSTTHSKTIKQTIRPTYANPHSHCHILSIPSTCPS